jgi:AcrR family transcriptional regulator
MTIAARTARSPSRPLRRDAGRTFDALLEATGQLLAEGGRDVTMADIAARAGALTATAYRHFSNTEDAFTAFYWSRLDRLIDRLERVAVTQISGTARFRAMCRVRVEEAIEQGPAEVHIRSPLGYLQRLYAEDPAVSSLHSVLVA